MKKLFILLISFVVFSAYSQEEKREVDFPMSVYDQINKVRNAKWNKNEMSIPDKIIEVTENGTLIRYEIPNDKNKSVYFYVNQKPYDYVLKVFDADKTDISTFFFKNGTFWCERHFQGDDGNFWVYHYSEKRFEGSLQIKK